MKGFKWLIAVLFISFVHPGIGGAMTPAELRDTLDDQGQRITVIDVRNSKLYLDSHIPGAINVPAAVVSVKRLPPLGRVIVYGDGIRTDLTREALTALNAKKGINAEMLEGGFGTWQALKLQTTRKAGLSRTDLHFLTYREIKKAAVANPDMVLVDLRTKGDKTLTDLGQEFPLQAVIRLSRDRKGWEIGSCLESSVRQKLFVLIDDGSEESNRVAGKLTTAGVKRIAILVGGEISLNRKGLSEKKTMVTTKRQP